MWSYLGGTQKLRLEDERRPSQSWAHSKKTPKATVHKLPPNCTAYITAFQLSLWDNLSGPRLDQMWVGYGDVNDEVMYTASRHALSGGSMSNQVETKFQWFSDLGHLITSVVFNAPYMDSLTKFALQILIPMEHLQQYLPMHSVVEDRMLQLVSKLAALLKVVDLEEAMLKFTGILFEVTVNLDRLFGASLPPLNFNQTLFAEDLNNEDTDFLTRAITAHFQTHAYTVVVGPDEDTVNTYINTLSLFLTSADERKRSCHAVSGRKYAPDLVLQGLINEIPSDDECIQSLYPTTIIDLNQRTVKSANKLHEYTILRKEFLEIEIHKLSSTKPKENLWTVQESMFRTVKTNATLVETMLQQTFNLPAYLRQGHITQCVRLLMKKAAVMIHYVEAYKKNEETDTTLDWGMVKKMTKDMEINSESDLSAVLGVAAKMHPGIYITVSGDPASLELKFIELFESF